METLDVETWAEANQRYLTARLAVVRQALTRHLERVSGTAVDAAAGADWEVRAAAAQLPAPAALDSVCAVFALSPFERDVLLLAAGVELEGQIAALCAAAHGDPQRPYPTLSLALSALPGAHWSALTPAAPLRRWRLIEVTGGEGLTTNPVRVDERVLHYLTGLSYLDERLQALIEHPPDPPQLPPSQQRIVDLIVELWNPSDRSSWPLLHLDGDERAGKRAVASTACALLGVGLRALRAADIPASAVEREALARLWEREALLNGCVLVIDCEGTDTRAALSFAGHTDVAMIVLAEGPVRSPQRPLIRLEVTKPDSLEQRELWRNALAPVDAITDEAIERLVSQFDLGAEEIVDAARQALSEVPADDGAARGARLWDVCRTRARTRLDDLAQRVDSGADWDDLVLPATQRQTLRDVAAQMKHRARVYDVWGFGGRGKRGLGITALFAGASGTGKTMAAEVLARELRLDLYLIDLSQVVSKYIGETEKNLRRVFDAAEAGGAVLLFDEADALFGKRSEVRDSHDRYANIEISYLLQRMESYCGLAILTTNMRTVLDVAFLRRIRFVVQFPHPDITLRAEIWRRVFPAQTPVADLDIGKLARLDVAGGNIRNIALHAAFLAADANGPVRMPHLLRAARTEYAKLEKPLTESEIRDWV